MQQGMFDNKPPEERFTDADGVELSLSQVKRRARATLENMTRWELIEYIEFYLMANDYVNLAQDEYGRWYPE